VKGVQYTPEERVWSSESQRVTKHAKQEAQEAQEAPSSSKF
jgi:hypothetical protein